jgi:SAM-dependent methyltransferase
MAGEFTFLKRMGVAEIDAFDLSEGQRQKFLDNVYDGSLPVNYEIADVNDIELPADRYDVVYLQHAYHHVERLEHVADQIRAALKPDGTLAIIDYVGANFLQRTPRQRDLCAAIWRTMPERYRVRPSGRVFAELRIPDKASLSPYEAVRSEEIVAVLDARFDRQETYYFGGILFPIFNGIAQNFTESGTDQEFLRVMWDLDRWLLDAGSIEPNFVKAIFTPRS